MELTLADVRELLALGSGAETPGENTDPVPGDQLLIRTVTMTLTGRVRVADGRWIVLDEAAWIADTGRFADAIATGSLSEVEPMGDGVRVAVGAVVDITPWRHALPTTQK